ncbi:mediator of DNA damage checkpoint protein 1 isoform X2 [Toxotes jaculatrix]|uniref:mediator of DNA damage checkpoint protein 1 isoform X2 n=1 Tax=Toxotes jaculatrix TaxID=941984 RepID=UPI001B3B0E9C|nr:mediator of DNA damage checkpoint protein 1 isoform X2 [Toxotes jaculatrix]
MDATQMINDSILESDEEENEEENENKRGRPLAKLCILKNAHFPETEFPLFLGDNVLGRDPCTCTLPLPAPSVSKQHATICISVYRRRGCHREVDTEALVWDLQSMNGTRKGRIKLTPNVRYALSDGDSLVVADIPCKYVSCAVDTVSSQGDMRTPVSRNTSVKARLPDASGEKGGDKSAESRKCVNGGAKARVSLTKTPVRTTCLSFEQTPTQPQGTLVPESDSDSDGERGGGRDRRCKGLVSDSDSQKSSPTCSTFLSPTNKVVPESEDESPITPSSSTKNKPYRHVGFSKEETEVDVGGQVLEEKKALVIVDDSEEEEERAAPEKSEQHVPVKHESNVSLRGEDELPVPTPAVTTDAIPAFNMDSDTDLEGEEEGVASAAPVTLTTNPVSQPPNTAQFHMDSDTDVDEDDDTLDTAPEPQSPKTVPSSDDHTKPPHVDSVTQPEAVTADSDTDVDDDAAVSDAATKAKPMSCQSAHTADTAPLMQPKDFHLDSDTDVDEEEEGECGTNKPSSKIDETPTRLDIKPAGPESAPAAHHSLHLDSDTDDEAVPAPALSEPLVVSAATESCTTADGGADKLSDSDTDVEDDSPLVIPVTVTTLSVSPGPMSHSDADTNADGPSVPPAGDGVSPADLKVDSDTDVEDEEAGTGEAGEGQIPNLCSEKTSGLLAPPLQNCSTPVQLSEGEVEDMETQAFLSPSSVPFRRAGPVALSSFSDSQEDEDFVVAETQSFVLQSRDCQNNPPEDHTMDPTQAFGLETSGEERDEQSSREGSFQLGLSDSSHLQCQAQALAMESTQAYVSVKGRTNLEGTQAFAAISSADRNSEENDPNLEATQACGEDVEPEDGLVDLALEATQAYISEPYSDSENERGEDKRKNATSTAETQPLSFPTSCTLAMAETQPMSAFRQEETLVTDKPFTSVQQVKTAQARQRPSGEVLSVADTQPIRTCDDEESNDEESILGPQKRKAKPLQLEEEQTQPLISSEVSGAETQPMHFGCAETQPIATSENEESDDEDSMAGPRKRKAKQLRLDEEQTQTLTNSELSVVQTQPVDTGEDGESDEEDSIPVFRKRKAKALPLEETQPLTESEVSTVETQPVETHSGEQPERRRGGQSESETSGVSGRNKRGTRARLREEEEQAEYSEPQKRQTREKKKASRGIRGKFRPDDNESEEEEEVNQARRAREKKSLRQQKDDEEEHEKHEREGNEDAENGSLKIKKQEGGSREETDAADLRNQERETMEKEKRVIDEREQKEIERQHRREEQEKIDRERKEMEEQERLQADRAEMIRLEQQRAEKEKNEQEKVRYDLIQKEKEEQLERERKANEEKERLEHEKAEREEKEKLEREETERIEKERKEQEEKERLETEKRELEERLERERKEQEHQARLQREAKEREERERLEKEKEIKEQQENKEELNKLTRGRRATRRTMAALCTTESEQNSTISTNNDDVPARRTRSRSNSSNSVSSERSASSLNTQESRGRGRGRGAKRTSEPPQASIARSSNRRTTVAAETTEWDSNDISPQGVLSRSNSSSSLHSEISSCSVSSQNRGRGSRQRGRLRKTEPGPNSIPPVSSQSDQNSDPKPAARGRKSRRTEGSSNVVLQEDNEEKTDPKQASTTRGRRGANTNDSKPTAADEEGQSVQEEGCAREESLLPKRNVRGRGQKAAKSETIEAPVPPAVSDGREAKDKRKGRKRELEANTEEDSSSSSKISKGKETVQTTEATEEEGKGEAKDENPVQAKRRSRASTTDAKRNSKESPLQVEIKEESEKMEKDIVEKRARGRSSAVQKNMKVAQEESGTSVTSMKQDAKVEASETRTSSVSRKRQAPVGSSPVAKTPRSSPASPAASGRLRAVSQAYKVLFTGVVDEAGERVLARLGGSMAKGVADMNCLVTDKVRRTVKFLCAVAKGVPIVTTHWLEKSGKAGSFLSPNAFIVKDLEQEKKFSFSLQESLRIASNQPLLQGYEIHVTKSVKPEPVQMKDIISCSGATFLPKMPSSHKPQTVVISCEEDRSLCGPAVSASLPVVTAEFILTGILQQKVDFQTHTLSATVTNQQPVGGRGRGRKKS